MRNRPALLAAAFIALTTAGVSLADVKVVVDRNEGDAAGAAFKFKSAPSPVAANAATGAKFTIVDGRRDTNGGPITVLNDGKLPGEADEPAANFFFAQGAAGGRIAADLGKLVAVKEVNTYSWHAGPRGPQVYTLYASDGTLPNFNAAPKAGTDPVQAGWTLVAKVDARPKGEDLAGQYAVSISDSAGLLGKFRYLLFDVARTEDADPFGNTFFSEINVIDTDAPTSAAAQSKPAPIPPLVFHSKNPDCEIVIDTSGAPELKEWVETKLGPTLAEWYPRIVAMLPSDGYVPPSRFTVQLRPGSGVAATGNTRVTANSTWLKGQLNREAVGALVHEEVHVVQQYGYGRTVFTRRAATQTAGGPQTRPATRPVGNPVWLVEGVADYIRWWYYEPPSPRRFPRATRYDGSYTVSANFLHWVSEKYDHDIVIHMNAAMREQRYSPDLWKEYTGKTVEELNDEWKKANPPQTRPATRQAAN